MTTMDHRGSHGRRPWLSWWLGGPVRERRSVRAMPRRNRFTIKTRSRTQRSKRLHNPFVNATEAAVYRTHNPRWDERGESRLDTAVAVLLAVLMGIMCFALLFLWFAPQADARAVNLEPAVTQQGHRPSPVLYVEHVQYRWYYVEFANGATWMVTRCKHEDSNNCWWNAEKRGNGEGRSFVVIKQHYHLTVRGTVVR